MSEEEARGTTRAESHDIDIFAYCKKLITCDADNCETTNPKHRCARCQGAWYCSKKCQAYDWRHGSPRPHKSDCVPIENLRKSLVANQDLIKFEADEPTVGKVLGDKPECGVCFEELSKNSSSAKPIVLEGCNHVFCFSCLKRWHETVSRLGNSTPTCPLCRKEVPDVNTAPWQNATGLIELASLHKESSRDICEKLIKEALQQVAIYEDEGGSQTNILMAKLKGEIAVLNEKYEDAIEIYSDLSDVFAKKVANAVETDRLRTELESIMYFPGKEKEVEDLQRRIQEVIDKGQAAPVDHVTVLLELARAQGLAKNWEDCRKTHTHIIITYKVNASNYDAVARRYPADFTSLVSLDQEHETATRMSECGYYLNRLDKAIQLGEYAIEMCRWYPWSHKYLALALKDEGYLEKAKRVAAEAVIFETPEDSRHRAKVQQWFRDEFL